GPIGGGEGETGAGVARKAAPLPLSTRTLGRFHASLAEDAAKGGRQHPHPERGRGDSAPPPPRPVVLCGAGHRRDSTAFADRGARRAALGERIRAVVEREGRRASSSLPP